MALINIIVLIREINYPIGVLRLKYISHVMQDPASGSLFQFRCSEETFATAERDAGVLSPVQIWIGEKTPESRSGIPGSSLLSKFGQERGPRNPGTGFRGPLSDPNLDRRENPGTPQRDSGVLSPIQIWTGEKTPESRISVTKVPLKV